MCDQAFEARVSFTIRTNSNSSSDSQTWTFQRLRRISESRPMEEANQKVSPSTRDDGLEAVEGDAAVD